MSTTPPTLCTCPVCSGTTRQPVEGTEYAKYRDILSGYRAADDTIACTNCGGQTMFGRATGQTRARPDGTPCIHEYTTTKKGNCYHVYTCKHCGYQFDIDSGD